MGWFKVIVGRMVSALYAGDAFRLRPSRAHAISCLLTISCAALVHHTSVFQKRGGIDIVRLPPTKLAKDSAPGPGRALSLPVRIGSVPSVGQKGWLGAMIQTLELPLALSLGRSNAEGALIVSTTAGGPAAQAGIRAGDIIVRYGGNAVANSNDLRRRVMTTAPQSEVPLVVWRAAPEGSDYTQLLHRLAEGGNAHIMYQLGSMFEFGSGVARDAPQALSWYRKGADAGNASAMTALGVATIEGRG
jgi:hypothetical protein